MWIVIRIALAVIGLCVRWVSRGRARGGTPLRLGDLEVFQKIHQHKNTIKGFTLAAKRASPTWARFHSETSTDRWFKRIGISNEVQTGDAAFDEAVYVTSDHPFVATLLADTPDFRAAIRAVLDSGVKRISFDGARVSYKKDSAIPPTERDFQLFRTLWETSWRLEDEPRSRFSDPFLWKALVVEGVLWSIAGVAIGAGLEMIAHRPDIHASKERLIVTGLVVAAAAFAVVFIATLLWMRGSSRGHRVILESAVLMALSFPIAGIQLVGDTNRALDDAPATTVKRQLIECETRVHRGKRGRKSYSYHLHLSPTPESEGPPVPDEIETDHATCLAATPGAGVEIDVKPGRWRLPWYSEIRVGGERWTPP